MPIRDALSIGADSDADGRLNEKEYGSYAIPARGIPASAHQINVVRNFADVDANADGFISGRELRQATN